MTQKIAIQVDDLTVAYNYKPVLWDIDLVIPEGVLMAIVGPNGAGKSTLMKCLNEQLSAMDGEVYRHYKLRVAMFTQVNYFLNLYLFIFFSIMPINLTLTLPLYKLLVHLPLTQIPKK